MSFQFDFSSYFHLFILHPALLLRRCRRSVQNVYAERIFRKQSVCIMYTRSFVHQLHRSAFHVFFPFCRCGCTVCVFEWTFLSLPDAKSKIKNPNDSATCLGLAMMKIRCKQISPSTIFIIRCEFTLYFHFRVACLITRNYTRTMCNVCTESRD